MINTNYKYLKDKLTILVNSSDGFDDCWEPFFILFSKYWENCDLNIVLNTEKKTYINLNKKLNIKSSKVGANNTKFTWSECLIEALKKIETPFVLYFQEDYFIEDKIDVNLIYEFVEKMEKNKIIKNIGLTDIGSFPPFDSYIPDNRLWIVSNTSKYRISTQAALWNKDTLLSYLIPEESGWMFELFGTKRAKKRNDLFLTANRNLYNSNNNPIIKYLHTGIIKGKWHKDIPSVFSKNDITNIDYSRRGFYEEKNVILRKLETGVKLIKSPKLLFKYLFS